MGSDYVQTCTGNLWHGPRPQSTCCHADVYVYVVRNPLIGKVYRTYLCALPVTASQPRPPYKEEFASTRGTTIAPCYVFIMASHLPDSVPTTNATTANASNQSSRSQPELRLTDEEKELQKILDEKLKKPKTRLLDTVNERLQRFEPLAQSIEDMLEMPEFESYVDENTRLNARQYDMCFVRSNQSTNNSLLGRLINSGPGRPRLGPDTSGIYRCLLFSVRQTTLERTCKPDTWI